MSLNRRMLILAPALLAASLAAPASAEKSSPGQKSGALTCPVMKAPIKDKADAAHVTVNNEPVYVCCPGCIPQIKKEPAKYLKQVKDPVTGKPFTVTAKSPRMEHGGGLFLFASAKTHAAFHAHPGKYAKPAKGGKHGADQPGHGK